MTNVVGVRYLRIATKERPHDRFLTTQVREAVTTDDKEEKGDLYFLVEIDNTWFSNAQIGQKIINTVAREYRRGESASILTNFELALRKTNTVLTEVTQNGDTDWIGNLSSIILLISDTHVHLAQTGNAHAYLARGGRISEITEGVPDETPAHPLTTYTNITSGIVEPGDRIILGSSAMTDGLTITQLKPAFLTQNLDVAGHDVIQILKQAKIRRANIFLIDAGVVVDSPSTTLYVDDHASTMASGMRQLYHKTILPAWKTSSATVKTHSAHALRWSREWLIPRLIEITKRGTEKVVSTGKTVIAQRKPAMLKKIEKKLQSDAQTDIEGAHAFTVHHYSERKQKRPLPTLNFQAYKKTIAAVTGRLRLVPRQMLFLTLAGLAIIVVTVSVATRREKHQATLIQSASANFLEEAGIAQQNAERSFILGQKESAKEQFLLALTKAQAATAQAENQVAAQKIINQAQSMLDKLIEAVRIDKPTTVITGDEPIVALGATATNIVSLGTTHNSLAIAQTTDTGSRRIGSISTAPQRPGNTTLLNNRWYVMSGDRHLIEVNPEAATVTPMTTPQADWPQTNALATFGKTLYLTDTETGQILKYAKTDSGFAIGKTYLKTPDSPSISQTVAMAIDGDVYLLGRDGTARKYTKGTHVSDWKLGELPSPWKVISAPISIAAAADSSSIYILENGHDTQPARILEFGKDGHFIRQILLPDQKISNWFFDPPTKSGYIATENTIYKINLP